MYIKKDFDLLKSDNVLFLNNRDITKHLISKDDVNKIIDSYLNTKLKIHSPLLVLVRKIFEDHIIPNFSKYSIYFEKIVYVNLDKYTLPAYYNVTEKNIICNFSKPIYYLNINDIIANILYAYSYKSILKLKRYSRNMLQYFGNIYTRLVLQTFGKKEGILSSLKNVALLTLITYKFVDKQFFDKDNNLGSYIQYIDNKYVKQSIDESEIKYIEKYVKVDSFKDYVETLNKTDIIQRIDHKAFISILYNRYQRNENIISLFDTFERFVPFIMTLNFSNYINGGFGGLFKENDVNIMNITKYGISLISMII